LAGNTWGRRTRWCQLLLLLLLRLLPLLRLWSLLVVLLLLLLPPCWCGRWQLLPHHPLWRFRLVLQRNRRLPLLVEGCCRWGLRVCMPLTLHRLLLLLLLLLVGHLELLVGRPPSHALSSIHHGPCLRPHAGRSPCQNSCVCLPEGRRHLPSQVGQSIQQVGQPLLIQLPQLLR
jgi:hypothetical protein